MKACILEARTVALVRDLKVEQRQGANGTFESKDILFRIAVNRDYKVTRQENGKTISEYPTDFWLAKATGPLAQIFKDNCCKIKEDGKLVSRHLLLSGSFENYTNTRKVQVQPQVDINGQIYQLNLEVDVPNNTNTIFIVDGITFLDSNPDKQPPVTSTTVTSATAVPVPTPQPTQTAQPVATPAQTAPVQNTQPVATPAQTTTPVATPVASAATPANPVAGAMNPPVVGAEFSVTGEQAPF